MLRNVAHNDRLGNLVTARRVAVIGALLVTTLALAAPAAAAPGPPEAPEWWFDAWQVPSLWTAGARGQGVVIAEIDTGVNASLAELSANVLPGKDFGNPSLDGRTDHELETFGHGTAMASLMVAHTGLADITGLAPDAKLLPIAVPIRGTDDAPAVGSDQVPAAIRWAADHGGKIISMSLGGERFANRDRFACPQDEQTAITYAIGKGAIVVASAGNAAAKGSPVEDPGVCLGVISVGAVDDNGAVASFSSRHPYLTMTAPGVSIPSLGRDAGTAFIGDGTSQATALTSAALRCDLVEVPHADCATGGRPDAGYARPAQCQAGPGVWLRDAEPEGGRDGRGAADRRQPGVRCPGPVHRPGQGSAGRSEPARPAASRDPAESGGQLPRRGLARHRPGFADRRRGARGVGTGRFGNARRAGRAFPAAPPGAHPASSAGDRADDTLRRRLVRRQCARRCAGAGWVAGRAKDQSFAGGGHRPATACLTGYLPASRLFGSCSTTVPAM